MSIYIADGSRFIAETKHVYDMIIIDAFVDAAIPSSFRTAAFMGNLRTHSSKRGIIAVNVIGSLKGLNSSVLRSLHARLQAVFPVVELFPADRDYSLWMSQNYVLVAHDGSWNLASCMFRSPVDLPNGLQ